MDEGRGVMDRTVDVTFRGKMQHRVRLVPGEDALHGGGVADVGALERVARIAGDARERFQVRRISELVDVEDRKAVGHQPPARGRADEPRASGDQHPHPRDPHSKHAGRSLKRGSARSFSETTAAAAATGQAMPSAGSAQLTPRSCAAEYTLSTL